VEQPDAVVSRNVLVFLDWAEPTYGQPGLGTRGGIRDRTALAIEGVPRIESGERAVAARARTCDGQQADRELLVSYLNME
jgi:hypothetical protein